MLKAINEWESRVINLLPTRVVEEELDAAEQSLSQRIIQTSITKPLRREGRLEVSLSSSCTSKLSAPIYRVSRYDLVSESYHTRLATRLRQEPGESGCNRMAIPSQRLMQ